MNGVQTTVVKDKEVEETVNGMNEVINDINVKTSDVKKRFPLPKNISNFKTPDSNSDEENDMALALVQQQGKMEEPDDDWMDVFAGKRMLPPPKIIPSLKDDSTALLLPETTGKRIYPNRVKTNIAFMKKWVNEKIVSQMSDDEIMEKYYERRETLGFAQMQSVDQNFANLVTKMRNRRRNSKVTRDLLIDSLAYMISRKIWYVGRRPSDMTDFEWNEHTKYSRPSEGSYGGGDKWTDFKYDVNYKYQLGVY